jgi:hypothetical protein
MVIDDLVAGKMADSRYLMDTLGMMQQLDVLPVPVTNQTYLLTALDTGFRGMGSNTMEVGPRQYSFVINSASFRSCQ